MLFFILALNDIVNGLESLEVTVTLTKTGRNQG